MTERAIKSIGLKEYFWIGGRERQRIDAGEIVKLEETDRGVMVGADTINPTLLTWAAIVYVEYQPDDPAPRKASAPPTKRKSKAAKKPRRHS